MLEARAAVYAASIANYNNKMSTPIRTEGGEVGIPADKASDYYKTALAAAENVIKDSPYILQDRRPDNKGLNFYEATSVKTIIQKLFGHGIINIRGRLLSLRNIIFLSLMRRILTIVMAVLF